MAPGARLNNSLGTTTGSGMPVPSGTLDSNPSSNPSMGTNQIPGTGTPSIDSSVAPNTSSGSKR